MFTVQNRFAEGWFFCFQSREYLETGEFSSQLAGNSPFIVDKDTGEIHELGTAYPIEKYLQDYEWKKLAINGSNLAKKTSAVSYDAGPLINLNIH